MIYVTMVVEDGAELSTVPGQIVHVSTTHPCHVEARYEHSLCGGRYADVVSSDMSLTPWRRDSIIRKLKGQDGWIPHTGAECPVHPLDVVRIWFSNHESNPMLARAWEWDDETLTHYRHATDPDGTPYVYDDGDLPEDAEYVATDEGGQVYCYEARPYHDHEEWIEASIGPILPAPDKYANTTATWTETLRRVYR